MATPYCTVQNLCNAYDQKTVAQLCGDAMALLPASNEVIEELILQASGEIAMHARVAERYTDDQLDALAADEDPTLSRMAVDITMKLLYLRRGRPIPEAVKEQIAWTERKLEGLQKGMMIFPSVDAAAQAGVGAVVAVPTNLLANVRPSYASPYFPLLPGQTYPGGA